MADVFGMETYGAGPDSWNAGSGKLTGDLRRKYNFGDRVSELNIAQDPFFRMVSKLSKKPTDDPEFKFTERRPSFHKRYAYVTAVCNDNATWVENQSINLNFYGYSTTTSKPKCQSSQP